MFQYPVRTVSVPDVDASDPNKCPRLNCKLAYSITAGGWSNVKGATITFRLIFLDGCGNVQGSTPPIVLVAGQNPDWGAAGYIGVPSNESVYHCLANVAVLKVDAITWGVSAPPANAAWVLACGFQSYPWEDVKQLP